jgi:hypothetical protein
MRNAAIPQPSLCWLGFGRRGGVPPVRTHQVTAANGMRVLSILRFGLPWAQPARGELQECARRLASRPPDGAGSPYAVGLMFWLWRNRFVGSYVFFRATSRS